MSSEPQSTVLSLGAVLLGSCVCERSRGFARMVLRTRTQGIARQASLIPGLGYGSLSGYGGAKRLRRSRMVAGSVFAPSDLIFCDLSSSLSCSLS